MQLNIHALIKSVSEAVGHLTSSVSHELVGFAKGNITQQVTTLVSTQHGQSAVDAVGMMADYLKFSGKRSSSELFSGIIIDLLGVVTATDVVKHCAGSALANLARTVAILNTNPLDYVPDSYEAVMNCLHEEAAKENIYIGWFLLLLLLFIIMTVLFGHFWPVAILLRVGGFGCLGPIAGMLSKLFYPQTAQRNTEDLKHTRFGGGHAAIGSVRRSHPRWWVVCNLAKVGNEVPMNFGGPHLKIHFRAVGIDESLLS